MHDLTHLDLFSGIGGFSLGFESVGFQTIAFAETDAQASLILQARWPTVPNLGDVTKLCRRAHDCESEDEDGDCWCPRYDDYFSQCDCVGTDQFTDTYGWPDVITGGVPCQPASALGQMRGAADERWLWPEALRVVRELRPRFAVFENPPSVLVLPDFHRVIGEITALGYDLWWDVIPAAATGAGHLRERVFFVLADRSGWQTHQRKRRNVAQAQCGRQSVHPTAGPRGETPADASGRRRRTRTGLCQGESPGQRGGRSGDPHGAGDAAAHADHPRLQGHAGHDAGNGGWPDARRSVAPPRVPDLRGRVCRTDWWHETHTGIPVLAHGISAKLAQAACRCAGNAIVPQVAQIIAEALRESILSDE